MIEIRDVTKVYNQGQKNEVVALDNINLSIKKGEIFGIIGLSGAGKSTLLRCINMLEEPTTGRIVVDGVEITSLSKSKLRNERRKIGMIFQHFNLLVSRTVFENIALPMKIVGANKSDIDKRVSELLELVGLEDKKCAYPSQLSGGQKQRVGIARALASNPKLLLCDEATSALDPQTTYSILQLLKSINRKLGLTIVLITHEMGVIKEICDRVAVMDTSRVIEQGTTLDLFSQPCTETAQDFVKTTTLKEIPDDIIRRVCNKVDSSYRKLLQVSFVGPVATESVISEMVKSCGVDANILYGNLDYLQNTIFGTLLVEISGEADGLADALSFLNHKRVRYEVIRYDN